MEYRYFDHGTGKYMINRLYGQWGLDSVWPITAGQSPGFNSFDANGIPGWQTAIEGRFSDSPGTGGLDYWPATPQSSRGDTKLKEVFETYIMFSPGGAGDQWVPLQFAHWSWDVLVRYLPQRIAAGETPYVIERSFPTFDVVGPAPESEWEHPTWNHNVADPATYPGGENNDIIDPNQALPV